LKLALDLGLIWAWAPENGLRGPIGRAEPSSTLGFRAVSNRTDHDSRRCGARFEPARRGPPIRTAEMALNGVVSELAVGEQERGEAEGDAAAAHPRHTLAARPVWDARTRVGDPVRSRLSQSMRSCTPTRR